MIKQNGCVFELGNTKIRYIMIVNEYGYLENLYFGKKIDYMPCIKNARINRGHGTLIPGETDRNADAGNVRFEYSSANRGDYRTPSFEIEFDSDGDRCCDLKYLSHRIVDKDLSSDLPKCDGGETLEITLLDENTGLKVYLYYTVYDDIDAIVRSVKVENTTTEVVYLDKFYSFNIDVPNENYSYSGLFGAHLRERKLEQAPLTHGLHTFNSRRGETSSVVNPFVALHDSTADEHSGNVFGFNLIYSGNFELNLELDEFDSVRVNGGISSEGFRWKLNPGDVLETPECVLVYSCFGFNKMSQTFHDLYRRHLANKQFINVNRPIVINSWEATYYNFDDRKLKQIIDNVAESGIDTFVLDDGWFAKRDDDTTSLGDWICDKTKLPNGIKDISDYCHNKGLKFGLWFEPEAITPDSNLYKEQPEWVLKAPRHIPSLARSEFVLDLSNDAVRKHLTNVLLRHIEENKIDYIKWDMNRSLSDCFSQHLPKSQRGEVMHRYILGLYNILNNITQKHPHVLIEGCASGGCRFDAGILKYCPHIWVSDNTDAYMRAEIQRGTSYCYPLSSMSNHVSACPNHQTQRTTSLKTRFDVASFGVLGYELDFNTISAEERGAISKQIDAYTQDRELIMNGDYYRLITQNDVIYADVVVSKDKSKAILKLMYGLKVPNTTIRPIKIWGLDENTVYRFEESNEEFSGNILENRGIVPDCSPNDFYTEIYHLTRVE